MGRAYVLLSGGIDSTTCLHLAHKEFGADTIGISVFYGQRHTKEIQHASESCLKLGIAHQRLDISSVIPRTMLTDSSIEVPNISYSDITGVSPTYVPFRNGTLLSCATAHIVGQREKEPVLPKANDEWALYFGAHAEDAQNWAYPDCTPEFIGAMANAIFVGTYQAIRLYTPLEWLTKAVIIKLGDNLGVDWSLTWSCYKGEEVHCGVCPTCRARREGFIKAGVPDPTIYAK